MEKGDTILSPMGQIMEAKTKGKRDGSGNTIKDLADDAKQKMIELMTSLVLLLQNNPLSNNTNTHFNIASCSKNDNAGTSGTGTTKTFTKEKNKNSFSSKT